MPAARRNTPPEKADYLRPLLERCGSSVSAATHLKPLVPKIEADEQARLKQEVSGNTLSLVFDGTSHVGEATSLVARWCDSGFKIQQRLIDHTSDDPEAHGCASDGAFDHSVRGAVVGRADDVCDLPDARQLLH